MIPIQYLQKSIFRNLSLVCLVLFLTACDLVEESKNNSPTAKAGEDINYPLETTPTTITLNGEGSDSDGSVTAFEWRLLSSVGLDGMPINGTDTQVGLISPYTNNVNVIVPPVAASYEFQLTVIDDKKYSGTDTVVLNVGDGINFTPADDDSPMVFAGADQTVIPGDRVQLFAVTDDLDGRISFNWTATDGLPEGAILQGANSRIASFVVPSTISVTSTYAFEVTASAQNDSVTDIVLVTVEGGNLPPVVNAGLPQTVRPGDTVFLSGTAADADPVKVMWTQLDAGNGVTVSLNNANTNSATFVAPLASDLPQPITVLRFQFSATETATETGIEGLTSNSVVNITIDKGATLPAPLPSAAVNVEQNLQKSSGEQVFIPATATNFTGTVSYQWEVIQPIIGLLTTEDLTNANAATVSFLAPTVIQSTSITLKVTATDQIQTKSAQVVVTINPVSSPTPPPSTAKVTVGPDFEKFAGETVTVTATAENFSGTISYVWRVVSGPLAIADLNNSNTNEVSFTAPTVAQADEIVLAVTASAGRVEAATDQITITINPVIPQPNNQPPIASAGPDLEFDSGQVAIVPGSGSDPDNNPISFQWTQVNSDPVVELRFANTATVSFDAPIVAQATIIMLQLTVTDSANASTSDAVAITINPVTNIAPTADAGPNRQVGSGETISIVGGGTDIDGSIVTYQWVQSSGTPVALQTPNTANTGFISPQVTAIESIVLQLTVTDNSGDSGSSSVTITVIPPAVNAPPIANAGSNRQATSGDVVSITGTGTDAEGEIIAFMWSQLNNGAPTVQLQQANTATVSFDAPDVTATTDIILRLTVTDVQLATGTSDVTITVLPLPNNLPIVSAGQNQTVLSGDNVSLTGTATDSDGQVTSVMWAQQSGPTATLNGTNTLNASFTAPTVTVSSNIVFQLTATDNNNGTSSANVTVTVNPLPVNIPPTVTITGPSTATSGATVSLMANAADSDGLIAGYIWSQSQGPSVTFLPNNTMQNVDFVVPVVIVQTAIVIDVLVEDDKGATASSSFTVTVDPAVGNVAPIVTAGDDQNVDPGSFVTLTGTATDIDGTIVSTQWLQTSGATLTLTPVVGDPLSVDIRPPFNLTVLTVYDFDFSATDNSNATSTASVRVTVYPPTSLSGQITTAVANMLDNDVNYSRTTAVSNNTTVEAQHLSNPVILGGYVNQPGTGPAGQSQIAGDTDDFYHVIMSAGQTISLHTGNPVTGVNELGLYLIDEVSGATVDVSLGGTGVEVVSSTVAGNYFVNVRAELGASNYVLTVGNAPQAIQGSGWTLNDDFVPGEIIVKFKPAPSNALSIAGLSTRASSIGLQAIGGAEGRNMLMGLGVGTNKVQAMSTLGISIAKNFATSAPLQEKLDTIISAAALRKRSDVESVSLNYKVYPSLLPNDPNFANQWHYRSINLPQAWDLTTGSTNVIVAVIDTGVLLNHPDFGAGKFVQGYDFIRSDTNSGDGQPGIDPDPTDVGDGGGQIPSSFHGTHVAGTIAAASNNGIGVAGIGWNVRIMPLRAMGIQGGNSFDIEQSIRYAAGLANDSRTVPQQKADVINLSLGGPTNNTTAPLAYQLARAAGVIVVAAAGNTGDNTLHAPAAYNGVVSVSATTSSNTLASYSTFGTTIDVAAPGGSSPDGIMSTGGNDSTGAIRFNYNEKAGTSMAAPHMAGVVALMKSVMPTLTPDEFDTMLASGVLTQDLGTPGRDNSFGHGLIDAFKAVQAAINAGTPVPPPPPPPVMSVVPVSMSLAISDSSKPFTISNSGQGILTITSVTNNSGGWLTTQNVNVDGNGVGEYAAVINRTGLAEGLYNATISIESNGGPQTVGVAMQVLNLVEELRAGQQKIELRNADTNQVADVVRIDPDVNGVYIYQFPSVNLGTYIIRSGSDLDNDNIICELGESCGAYPFFGDTVSNRITVDGSVPSINNLNFETGFSTNLPVQ